MVHGHPQPTTTILKTTTRCHFEPTTTTTILTEPILPQLYRSSGEYCRTSRDCVQACRNKGFNDGGICSDYDKKCICNGMKLTK